MSEPTDEERDIFNRLMAGGGPDESDNPKVKGNGGFLTEPDNPMQNMKDVMNLFGGSGTKIIGIQPGNAWGDTPPISLDDVEDGDVYGDDQQFGIF